MDNTEPDVKEQAEETTAPESSPEEQTADTADNVETNESTEAAEEAAKTVPYERFREVNDKYRQMEQRMAEYEAQLKQTAPVDQQTEAVKQQLKSLGFLTQDEVEARMRQEREDARVERELSSLETTYSGKDGRPKFNRSKVLEYALEHGIPNPEVAYKVMHEKELIDWHIKQASTKTSGVKTEASDGSGSTQVGTTDDDLKAAIAKGDKSALHTFLKRSLSR